MLTKNIFFKNFKSPKNYNFILNFFLSILKEENAIIQSLKPNYLNSFKKKQLSKYKKFLNYRIIGMGGSSLGAQAIFEFLKNKVKKNFIFVNNLEQNKNKNNNNKFLNLVISKSGNTIETIVNSNILIKKKDTNLFITENKKNFLNSLAKKLKSEVIHHNNYIGGRYSVLSEVGMLPAELMGLKVEKFKQLNNLVKNKNFVNSLISNVSTTFFFLKKKKYNSIIINYDQNSKNLLSWYQQLVAESLGKKNIGILPIISNMPKDNHSVMQYYLDGKKNNFYTFFFSKSSTTNKINNSNILMKSHSYLKGLSLNKIIKKQFDATEKVFLNKNLPFRSFVVSKRDEATLGQLFCYFMLETILLGRALGVDPYNQPAVELIKTETKKNFYKK